MKRRLILVLQSISLIPPIVTFIVWLNFYFFSDLERYRFQGSTLFRGSGEDFFPLLLLCVPFTLLILGKYIVYGKFYIFKEKVDEQ